MTEQCKRKAGKILKRFRKKGGKKMKIFSDKSLGKLLKSTH